MIKKIAICTLILLLIHIIIRDYIKPDIIISQAEWQNTQIAVDNFIFDNENYENIIVGSSIGRRIITDSLPDFLNLCFEGNAAYSGINLIQQRNIYPKRVFIEINTLYKTEESSIKKSNSLIYPLQQHIPALRDGKQPLPLLEAFLETHITPRLIPFKFSIFADNETSNSLDSAKHEVMKQVLAQNEFANTKKKEQETEEEQINRIKNKLESYIQDLTKHNVDIYFFIVPAEGTHVFSNRIRNMIQQSFAATNVHYIPCPQDLEEYKTTDGWHLDQESAKIYTSYLKKAISRQLITPSNPINDAIQ